MTLDDIFGYASELHRWVPYKLVFNPKRQKHDKIPDNGRHGLSTADPMDWRPLLEAIKIAGEGFGLSGVGLVMTGGIEVDGLTLVGFDFDGITEEFNLPFETYTEWSPSGKGARAFAWAPKSWALKYQDSTDTKPPFCDHAEIYIGSAPRFLTVTFDTIQMVEFKQLTDDELKTIESWGMNPFVEKPAAPIAPDTAGTPVDFKRIKLTKDMQSLIDGTHEGDKSKTTQGLIIRLMDSNVPNEDILATLVHEPNLWAYLLSHRSNNEDKAFKFAQREINKAYPLSIKGKREALTAYNEEWADKTDALDEVTMAPLSFPMHIYDNAPGLVGEIARWIMQASRAPRQEFAYAAALSVVACLIGPYCIVGGGILNLYIALVGGTGTGKTEAIKAGLRLLSATDAKDCVMDFPASEAALRRQLGVTPNVLIRIDELAHKIDGLKDTANGSSMSRAILEGYDGDRMPPKVYADEKKTLPAVENPFMQILGGTTDKVWETLQTRHLEDGTINRFLFVCLPDDVLYVENPTPSHTIEKALQDRLNAFFRAGRMRDLIGDVPGLGFGRQVEFSTEAREAMRALGPEQFAKQRGEYGALYGRFAQHVGKVATILAVGDGRVEVGMREFEQALAFVSWSVETALNKVSGTLAGSQFEKSVKRVTRKLQKAKGGRMTMRELYRFMTITRREMDEIVAVMELSGTVTQDGSWVVLA